VFGSFRKGESHARASQRISGYTRDRFGLGSEDAVLVTEIICGMAGCPPLETVVAFWTADGTRHQFKIFKPVAEVTGEDLPPAWLKSALSMLEGFENDCC
jgi:nitrate reductase delta subunit